MHRLSSSFILGYHGCDRSIGEQILGGAHLKPSRNKYDWLGPGIYFWEANPQRGLEFAREASSRKASKITDPFVIGAVIDLGICLDLTTSGAIEWVKSAYNSLVTVAQTAQMPLPQNKGDGLRRNLDCAVIMHLHRILAEKDLSSVDTVKGVFTEGPPIYPGSGFDEKKHIQIAVCNPACVKGVFRVPEHSLSR